MKITGKVIDMNLLDEICEELKLPKKNKINEEEDYQFYKEAYANNKIPKVEIKEKETVQEKYERLPDSFIEPITTEEKELLQKYEKFAANPNMIAAYNKLISDIRK